MNSCVRTQPHERVATWATRCDRGTDSNRCGERERERSAACVRVQGSPKDRADDLPPGGHHYTLDQRLAIRRHRAPAFNVLFLIRVK